MRMKNLLGLLAIGGAVAYAQKRRGGDLSLNGFKKSLRGIMDSVRNSLGTSSTQTRRNTVSPVHANEFGVGSEVGGVSDVGATSSAIGSDNAGSTGYGTNDINRKY